MKRQVEVFSAGCPFCIPVVEMVEALACDSCEVTVHNVVSETVNDDLRQKLSEYGLKRIPAIAVNGELLQCCHTGGIIREELVKAGIGTPTN